MLLERKPEITSNISIKHVYPFFTTSAFAFGPIRSTTSSILSLSRRLPPPPPLHVREDPPPSSTQDVYLSLITLV